MMSNYVQVLRRLERGDQPPPAPPPRLERSGADDDERRHGVPAAARAPALADAAGAAMALACAPILERLRAMAAESAGARTLVFASVSEADTARELTGGIARRAEEIGLHVALGRLTRAAGRPCLEDRRADADGAARVRRAVDLDAASRAESVAGWIDQFSLAQLVLIDGPPLASSVDSLLLAAACDGLVIAAEAGVTERAALAAAAERARAAGCRVHGVVLVQPR
jgi:hypothetical protein